MSQELVDLLLKYNVQIPRYTSYPTAPVWGQFKHAQYVKKLAEIGKKDKPVSLYFHIPFCKTMCLFCACSVILNRRPENEERYIDYLCKEIELVSSSIGCKKEVSQLHLGGGTPTKISIDLLIKLFEKIQEHFTLAPEAEIAIEIDPRVEDSLQKLTILRRLGFNRVSFGVQDTNQAVQEAIRRRQSLDVTRTIYNKARALGFQGINIDLIYGLPKQTIESFSETIERVIELGPDRLALFSYAKVPWLKAHQKAIPDADLPTTIDKFCMYAKARKRLMEQGYRAIGMDHFAKKDDELALAYEKKHLQRNFQGYTVLAVDDLIGFGVTAIGFVNGSYVQNAKELQDYYTLLDNNCLAASKGKELTDDDHIRRWVIQRLMCDFAVDKKKFQEKFSKCFDSYFAHELQNFAAFDHFVSNSDELLQVHPEGELFIRNITSTFDYYLNKETGPKTFSKAV